MSDLVFSIVVDNFIIEYTQKEDSNHLLKYFLEDYTITEDWRGEK